MAHIVFVRIGEGIYDGHALWLFVFGTDVCMGESFQDYSWIQDFEADFPQKVSLKMLN